ncbi:MAG: hypothetical protein NVS2B8_03880 [Vulcanimicrobiaceae bacterium]
MKRRTLLTAIAGSIASGLPNAAFAELLAARRTTLQGVFEALPRPKVGDWTRIIMGSGVDYQKQIGIGTETAQSGELTYVETQIGTPGGSCNPNTMKRVYLRSQRVGSFATQMPALANVADSGTILTRWGDIGGGQTQTADSSHLRLFDAPYLYDDRTLTVTSVTREKLKLAFGTRDTVHVVAHFSAPTTSAHRLTQIELWSTPEVPFGLAKYRALARGMDPFEARVFSHGTKFAPALAMKIDSIRAITPDGTHIQTG